MGMLNHKIEKNCTAKRAILLHSGNNLLYFPHSNLADLSGIKDLFSINFKA